MSDNKTPNGTDAESYGLFGGRVLMHELNHREKLEKPGYDVAVVDEAEAAAPATPAEPPVPLATLIPTSSVEVGQALFKPCVACHTVAKGDKNKAGPNLYDILNRPIGSHEGFAYSTAMKEKGGNWGYNELYEFLAAPKTYLPGTKMNFGGFKKSADRANVVMYLRSLSDSPAPLPQ